MNTFELVVGKKLLKVDDTPKKFENGVVENDWGLEFEGECALVIFNNRKIENASSLKEFIGEKVLSIEEIGSSVIYIFTNQKKIIVSLEAKDWNGPEAMNLYSGDKIYTWRDP